MIDPDEAADSRYDVDNEQHPQEHVLATGKGKRGYSLLDFTDIDPRRTLLHYAGYGNIMMITCMVNLETWLANYRTANTIPKCSGNVYVATRVVNLRLWRKEGDPFKAGIIDVSTLNKPRVIEAWKHNDGVHAYKDNYRLSDALAVIKRDVETNYPPDWTYKVHILACFD